jgi:hypothetical protein
LILVVAVIVAIAQLVPHADLGSNNGVFPNGGAQPLSSAVPDDGLTSVDPPASPRTSPGAATPQAVAIAFATAWLHHDGVTAKAWDDGIIGYCTKQLAAQFDGVDPADVPANRITGDTTTTDYSATYVQVNVPMDGGTLVLGLQGPEGVWLVDTVDWNRD